MKLVLIVAEMLCTISIGWAQSGRAPTRIEAEYYVTAYAQHYECPLRWRGLLSCANPIGSPA